MGHDPKDVKATKSLIKKKDEDIDALRKQLKLPPSWHPKTAEVIKQKSEEEMMDLPLKLNERLNYTERALEKALKDRQGELTSQPVQTAITIETAPPTVTTIAPPSDPTLIAGTSTSVAVSATTTAATKQEASLSMEEMMKEIKALEVQMAELKVPKRSFQN